MNMTSPTPRGVFSKLNWASCVLSGAGAWPEATRAAKKTKTQKS